ncbi:LysR family transcriptional regulator [Chthonobacter rhizosphaerae]|uniref:LysR family transcriptional regulator n=1 Tax=Chthonobacter rhizosphaerae TaxID=2735553 RepID=UPI0015EF85FC|nr:LysR family transcriptional regulator [Chthonobacter rhizosphaerae]
MNLNRLAYYAAVVDTGSFTKAAERLGITKAVVSQQVAQLEKDVGTTLLVRTTRRVRPTEAGLAFHVRCRLILREAEDAFSELAEAAAEPTGTLRILAPNDYGTTAVVPVAAAFVARHPACRVDLTLGDERTDLAAGDADMAIRLGWLTDSSLQARRIGSFQQRMVAGAVFADRLARIVDPEALSDLPFVANTALREPLVWEFSRGDLARRTVRMKAAISTNATPAVLAAVKAGAGLAVLPGYQIEDDLATGGLVEAVPEWRLLSGGIHAVFPPARFRPAKVTAFVTMLSEAERSREAAASGQRVLVRDGGPPA